MVRGYGASAARIARRWPFAAADHTDGAPTAPSDELRQRARCTGLRRQGRDASSIPTWGGNSVGFMPFPTDG